MSKRLLLIIAVLVLSVFPGQDSYAIRQIINTTNLTILPEGNSNETVELRFGPSINQNMKWDPVGWWTEASSFLLDDNLTINGKLQITDEMYGPSNAVMFDSLGHIQEAAIGEDVIKDSAIDWGTGFDQISADSIPDGSSNVIITATQETNFGTAYSHSQVTSGNPHSISLDDAYDSSNVMTIDNGALDMNVTGAGDGSVAGIDMDVTDERGSGNIIADFSLNWVSNRDSSIDLDTFLINRNTDMAGSVSATSTGSILKLTETITNSGIVVYSATALEIEKSRDAVGDYITGTYNGTEYFSIEYDGDIVTAGDLYVSGKVGISTAAPQSLLDIQGPVGTGAASAGILTLATKDLTIVDGDQLGRINFNAPLESDGGDSRLVAAAIWAEADDTFSTTVNSGELVFATGQSEAATEKMRIDKYGLVGIGSATPATNLYIYENSASAIPMLEIEQAGTGDPALLFDSDGNEFAIGIDSSDSDKFVISDSTGLGTNNRLTIDSTGNISLGGDVATVAGKGYSYNGTTVLNNTVSVAPDSQGTWPLELTNQGTSSNNTLNLRNWTSTTATAAFICNIIKDPDATAANPIHSVFWKYGIASPDWRDNSLENHASTGDYSTVCSWVQMDTSQRIMWNFSTAGGDSDAEFFVNVSAYIEPTT